MLTKDKTIKIEKNKRPNKASVIYHMLPTATWTAHNVDAPYKADTLTTDGFIHCTGDRELLVKVANNFYRDTRGPFVILCIDEALVKSETIWEEAGMHNFPHIYGPLNLDAIIDIIPFPQRADGVFEMPRAWCK